MFIWGSWKGENKANLKPDSVKQEVIQEVTQPTFLRLPFSHFAHRKPMPRKMKSFTN